MLNIIKNSGNVQKMPNFQERHGMQVVSQGTLNDNNQTSLHTLDMKISNYQNRVHKLETVLLFLKEFDLRLKSILFSLPETSDRKWRQNQIYNSINSYIYENRQEAFEYVKAAGTRPNGLVNKLKYGSKIAQTMKKLRGMFTFLDKTQCCQKIKDPKDNEDLCTGLKLFLCAEQPNWNPLKFLQQKILAFYQKIKQLKLMKLNIERHGSAQNRENASPVQEQKNNVRENLQAMQRAQMSYA